MMWRIDETMLMVRDWSWFRAFNVKRHLLLVGSWCVLLTIPIRVFNLLLHAFVVDLWCFLADHFNITALLNALHAILFRLRFLSSSRSSWSLFEPWMRKVVLWVLTHLNHWDLSSVRWILIISVSEVSHIDILSNSGMLMVPELFNHIFLDNLKHFELRFHRK